MGRGGAGSEQVGRKLVAWGLQEKQHGAVGGGRWGDEDLRGVCS